MIVKCDARITGIQGCRDVCIFDATILRVETVTCRASAEAFKERKKKSLLFGAEESSRR